MRFSILALTAFLWVAPSQAFAQNQPDSSLQDHLTALEKQINEMRAMMEQMQAEVARLRTASQAPQAETPVEKLQEDQELLNAKIDEQYQTKVETASKYRVRLSGTVLVNLFSNRGSVDNI